MFTKRLFLPMTGLLALALFAISLNGCQKETLNPADENEMALNFRGGNACDQGVRLLQMMYRSQTDNRHIKLYNQNFFSDLADTVGSIQTQNLSPYDDASASLLKFSANNGTVSWGSNTIGVAGTTAPAAWINNDEQLRIKLSDALLADGWNILSAGIWVRVAPGATVRVRMRKNGSYVQNPITRTNTGAGNLETHINLSVFYMFDEVEVSADAGQVQLMLNGSFVNRFIITKNTNDFIALRQRDGLYFWNSEIDNDHAGVFKPNHQYLSPTTGLFGLTSPDGNQWIDASASGPNFINRHKAGSAFGPAAGPGTDYGVNNGDTLRLKVGSSISGKTFSNVIVPIFRPSANAATPRIFLRKGGMTVQGPHNVNVQPGSMQYFLFGVDSGDFDEIVFTTPTTGNPQNYYEVRTDYWSILRFSQCETSGGVIINNPPAAATQIEDVPVDINIE